MDTLVAPLDAVGIALMVAGVALVCVAIIFKLRRRLSDVPNAQSGEQARDENVERDEA
jgi:hypothetical protein